MSGWGSNSDGFCAQIKLVAWSLAPSEADTWALVRRRLRLTHVDAELAARTAYWPMGALIHPRPAHRQQRAGPHRLPWTRSTAPDRRQGTCSHHGGVRERRVKN